MVAVSVAVFEGSKMLCQGRFLLVSDVDMSLLPMLPTSLATLEMFESVSITGRLHSVSTAASAEGFCLDVAPDNKVSLHVEFRRCHIFFNLCHPLHSEDADPTVLSIMLF